MIKVYMACLGVESGAAEWKGQTKPLSYGGTPKDNVKQQKPSLMVFSKLVQDHPKVNFNWVTFYFR